MTVLTKPFTAVQMKKPEAVVGGEEEVDHQLMQDGESKSETSAADFDEADYVLQRVHRIGYLTNFCLLLSLISLLTLGIGAGVHSYRTFIMRSNYVGTCRLPLRDLFSESTIIGASIRKMIDEEMYRSMEEERMKEEVESLQLLPEVQKSFEFDFDIDLNEENYEVVELPELFMGRYMHDFQENRTVIIDTLRDRCYILNLDRTLIPPPRNMFDMIEKMKNGVYNINFQEIKKNYRRQNTELTSLEGFGNLIMRACATKHSYMLEELVGDVVVKRDTEAAAGLERFGEFTGTNLLQYHISNLD
jgi:integral membrane protein 2B